MELLIVLGTYDTSKPRTRIILDGLTKNGVNYIECHYDVWGGVADKSQIKGFFSRTAVFARYLIAYPCLVWNYLKLPKHDAVFIGYLGLFDVILLWPFIRIRKAAIVWDIFISLYNTVVEDRRLIGKSNPVAKILWALEWIAIRMADTSVIDTAAHAEYIARTFHCSRDKITHVFVGAEGDYFNSALKKSDTLEEGKERSYQVLFYGQFIPLHGIDVVVRAAKLTEKDDIRWLLIGRGQEERSIRRLLAELKPNNIDWIQWVEYDQLINYLHGSRVALGIFGTTDKARRVIPNKVFQILLSGRPLITSDTPAIRELLYENDRIELVEPGSSQALADAVHRMLEREDNVASQHDKSILHAFTAQQIGADLLSIIHETIKQRGLC